MALTAYQTATRNLLQNPTAPTTLLDNTTLNTCINTARGQIAGEGECIRYQATINTVVGQRAYNFASLNTGTSATNGIQGAIHIRTIRYGVASGYQWIRPRPWEWFDFYNLNNPVPSSGPPTTWSQYGQGSATPASGSSATGSFYLDPIPDIVYTLTCDCVCFPIALADDTTVEAIPFLWTDAVPFFAAYYALLGFQTGARYADAERLFTHYETFMDRARKAANPSQLGYLYQQSTDPTKINQLGLQTRSQQ